MVYFGGTLDTAPGQRGSLLWRDNGSGQYIDAVIDLENSDYNFAVRLTTDRITDLQSWVSADSTSTSSGGLSYQAYPAAPTAVPASPTAPAPDQTSPDQPASLLTVWVAPGGKTQPHHRGAHKAPHHPHPLQRRA